MFSRNRDEHHESGTVEGMIRLFTASSLCFSKEPRPGRDDRRRGINISGVDFWHAVEFSRNGRFLCTHPRDSLAAFLRALPFGLAFPTLSDPFGPDSQSEGVVFPAVGPFR